MLNLNVCSSYLHGISLSPPQHFCNIDSNYINIFYMHKVILETNCEDGKVWIEGYFHRRTKTYKNSFFKLHDFCNIKNCVQKRKEYFALFNMLDTQRKLHCHRY